MGSQKVRHDGMTKYLLTHNYGQGYWEGLPSTPAEWFLECKLCQSSLVFSWSPPASSFSIFIFPSLLFLSSLETFANTHWLHSSWLGYFLYLCLQFVWVIDLFMTSAMPSGYATVIYLHSLLLWRNADKLKNLPRIIVLGTLGKKHFHS